MQIAIKLQVAVCTDTKHAIVSCCAAAISISCTGQHQTATLNMSISGTQSLLRIPCMAL